MTQSPILVCPHLGLAGDPTTARVGADSDHRCYAQVPPGRPDGEWQDATCVSAGYEACPFYLAVDSGRETEPAGVAVPGSRRPGRSRPGRGRGTGLLRAGPLRAGRLAALPWALLGVLLLAVVVVYGADLLGARAPAAPAATPKSVAATPNTPRPTGTPLSQRPSPVAAAIAGGAMPPTSTPEPGGRILTLSPKAGDAGWFASGEARGNHLGDSYLYAGYFDGQALISAVRIGFAAVPRGAAIREARLELVGLNDQRFDADAGGTWTVQLLPASALKDYSKAGFQELLNAPAAVTLVPTLFAADLAVGKSNTWVLDASGREWLEQQLLAGADAVVARIVGPSGGSETLFSWDTGAGPATVGEAPRLVLDLAAPPATPPSLPTEAVIVATLTPTPANVLTAVAYAVVATEQAALGITPLPYRIVTPTPPAENLATAQAYAAALGMPPLVVYTPTPENAGTAEADAWLATAVAVTTGTFTPVPTHAVTPVVITPTPRPQNAATALAQALTATAQALRDGTPTPWAANVLLATPTPPPVVLTATPANQETAIVRAAEATLTAMARGVQTPVWPGDRQPPLTPTPRPTTATGAPARTATPTPAGTPFASSGMRSTTGLHGPQGAVRLAAKATEGAQVSQWPHRPRWLTRFDLVIHDAAAGLPDSARRAIVVVPPECEDQVGKVFG